MPHQACSRRRHPAGSVDVAAVAGGNRAPRGGSRGEGAGGIAIAATGRKLAACKNSRSSRSIIFKTRTECSRRGRRRFPGCIAWGKTLQEAYRNAVDAIESCLEAREKIAAKAAVLHVG